MRCKIGRYATKKAILCVFFCVLLVLYPLRSRYPWYKLERVAEAELLGEEGKKVVFIYTSQRSGSTFLGEIFNQNENIFYLFEPLLPFLGSCLSEEKNRQALKDLSFCNLQNVANAYKETNTDETNSLHAKLCGKRGVCFEMKVQPALNRYAPLCYSRKYGQRSSKILSQPFSKDSVLCGFPLDMNIWSQLCQESNSVAFKIIRLCSLSSFNDVIEDLTHIGKEVHIIELVRDPRAIINSALKLELPKNKLKERADKLCTRLRQNLDLVKKENNTDGDFRFTKAQYSGANYMRVRYEDVALDPVKGAEKIYRNIGLDFPVKVKEWIEESSIDPSQKIQELQLIIKNSTVPENDRIRAKMKLSNFLEKAKDPYGTVRNSVEIISKWRKKLSMDIIHQIQEQCGDVMQRLGYKLINTQKERDNFTTQLW